MTVRAVLILYDAVASVRCQQPRNPTDNGCFWAFLDHMEVQKLVRTSLSWHPRWVVVSQLEFFVGCGSISTLISKHVFNDLSYATSLVYSSLDVLILLNFSWSILFLTITNYAWHPRFPNVISKQLQKFSKLLVLLLYIMDIWSFLNAWMVTFLITQ